MWFKKKIDLARIKAKNSKTLRRNGIEVIDHLPQLEFPDFRDAEQVAKRMMVLVALFQLFLQAPKEVILHWIEENDLMDQLTEQERQFLKKDFRELSEQAQTNIYWFVEAIWAFAWIGGLHDNLTLNSEVYIPNIEKNEPAAPFIKRFSLRPQIELISMLDKFYRAHWFARNNRLRGVVSNKVNLDLIMERRKALEYTCYQQKDWDNISLDT